MIFSKSITNNIYFTLIFFLTFGILTISIINYIITSDKLADIQTITTNFKDVEKLKLYQDILSYKVYEKESMLPSETHFDIGDTKLYINFDIVFKVDNYYICIKSYNVFFNTLVIYLIMIIIMYFLQLTYFIYSMKYVNKKDELIKLQGSEAKLASNNLSLLAENIHHELKTPLVVIVNKLDNVKTILNENETCKLCTMQETDKILDDISLVEMHIDVIYNLLDRMKNFKNIKRTTDNKSLYEIITVAFQTLELFSKTKFEFKIDSRLRNYIVNGKITNEDILNVFINHIKNSLEAQSTKFEVIMHKYHKNISYIQLIDNGNGMTKDVQEKIFAPNFSTKEINNDETRGIGLYLSKTTLQTGGGNDFLIDSSPDGTSFGINIPTLRR
jgi:signal transduction histidine kinase